MRVVLVTGASGGIGRSVARKFASLGDNVVIHYYSNKDKAEVLKRELEDEYSVRCYCVRADLSLESDIKNMVEEVIRVFKRIDVLVNNAGIACDNVLELKSVDEFRHVLDVNLVGVFLVSKYVSSYMLDNKSGCIVNIGSTNGIDSYYPYSMDYDASKAGVHVLTKDLAVLFAPYVRVNAVACGWIDTSMNYGLSDEFKGEEVKKIALGRFGHPDEVSNVVYFLASDDASYINGSVLVVDGGRK